MPDQTNRYRNPLKRLAYERALELARENPPSASYDRDIQQMIEHKLSCNPEFHCMNYFDIEQIAIRAVEVVFNRQNRTFPLQRFPK